MRMQWDFFSPYFGLLSAKATVLFTQRHVPVMLPCCEDGSHKAEGGP